MQSECKHDWHESYVEKTEFRNPGPQSNTITKDVRVFFCPNCEKYVNARNWEYLRKKEGDK